jgi:hypothetical protein
LGLLVWFLRLSGTGKTYQHFLHEKAFPDPSTPPLHNSTIFLGISNVDWLHTLLIKPG